MPMRLYCSSCGYTLWENNSTIESNEVMRIHSGKCPKCQKILLYNPDLVRLSPT